MNASIRRLERRLVAQRARLELGRLIRDYLAAWDDALKHDVGTPSIQDFIQSVYQAGYLLYATSMATYRYLEACAAGRTAPDTDLLLDILLGVAGQRYYDGASGAIRRRK